MIQNRCQNGLVFKFQMQISNANFNRVSIFERVLVKIERVAAEAQASEAGFDSAAIELLAFRADQIPLLPALYGLLMPVAEGLALPH